MPFQVISRRYGAIDALSNDDVITKPSFQPGFSHFFAFTLYIGGRVEIERLLVENH